MYVNDKNYINALKEIENKIKDVEHYFLRKNNKFAHVLYESLKNVRKIILTETFNEKGEKNGKRS